jgi:hexosaminidase
MNRLLPAILLFLLGLMACREEAPALEGSLNLLPLPAELRAGEGFYPLPAKATLSAPPELEALAGAFTDLVNQNPAYSLRVGGEGGQLRFSLDSSLGNPEAYRLRVGADGIELRGGGPAGVFYGIQTLRQMLPPQAEKPGSSRARYALPFAEIADAPRFAYRGLHLDVGRHFFPLAFLKKYIDLLAYHKLNTFHWHLTEDQGWRIEIKRYPRLTEVGAWRAETLSGHASQQPEQYDGQRYGGFYTQEEVRELVRYAQERFVTIIPEIEMPGHALAALAAYPELACTEGPFEVGKKWGIYEDIFCPTDSTFAFLENVLSEVVELFPSRYIHIGGDEAPKTRWEQSAFCQELIRREGLKDEHGLQSYFIRRIERFLNSKGRQIIGWDEILEGGLAPNATIMSWRGTEGGIAAARLGHDAIMTPTDFCYLDYYQADPAEEPLAIGGFLPIEKVYSYDPIPAELSPEEAQHILGAQANLWTEYLSTPDQVEYMVYPRACALAEVVWTSQPLQDFSDFTRRLPAHLERLSQLNVNYAPRFYDVSGAVGVDSATHRVEVRLSTLSGHPIHYTLDGSAPTAASSDYAGPVALERSALLTAQAFDQGKPQGRTYRQNFLIHKAAGRPVRFLQPPSRQYNPGPYGLTDGVLRSGLMYGGTVYTGFLGSDMEVVIDLGAPTPLSKISSSYLHSPVYWIFMPREVSYSTSLDGKTYQRVASQILPEALEAETPSQKRDVSASFEAVEVRYLRVSARSLGVCPPWHGGKGRPCFLFADEIVVE